MAASIARLRGLVLRKKAVFLEWRAQDSGFLYMYKNILYTQGCWPTLDREAPRTIGSTYRYWNPRLMVYTCALLVLYIQPGGVYLMRAQPLPELLEPIIFTFLALLLWSNFLTLTFRSERFQATLDAWETMTECARGLPIQSVEVTRLARKLNDVILFFFCASIGATYFMVFALLPLLVANRTFYSRGMYPYDEKATPYFELTLACWVLSLLSGTACCVPAFAMLATLLAQARCHLKLLRLNISAIGAQDQVVRDRHGGALQVLVETSSRRTLDDQESTACTIHAEMQSLLAACVRHHQAINNLVGNFEAAFDPIVTQYHVACAVPAGLAVLSLQQADHLDIKMAVPLLVIVVMFVSLGIISYLGNGISTESEAIREAMFGCPWFEASAGFKRSMCIIMSRSNQPLVITVAGFIPLSLETFMKVCKMTYELYKFMGEVKKVEQ